MRLHVACMVKMRNAALTVTFTNQIFCVQCIDMFHSFADKQLFP